MKKILLFVVFISAISFAQNENNVLNKKTEPITDELTPFVKANEYIVTYVKGDFNGDKSSDVVLVVANKDEKNLVNSAGEKYKRNLIILQRNRSTGKLEKTLENNDIIYCYAYSSGNGPPLTSINLKSNILTVEHSGGKMNRWARVTTFEYNREMQLWWLIKDASSTYNLSKGNDINSTIKTQDDFGFIYFQYFDAFSEDLTKQIKN